MHLAPMVNFDELLGHARFEHLRGSELSHEVRIAKLEADLEQMRAEVAKAVKCFAEHWERDHVQT